MIISHHLGQQLVSFLHSGFFKGLGQELPSLFNHWLMVTPQGLAQAGAGLCRSQKVEPFRLGSLRVRSDDFHLVAALELGVEGH